MKTSPGQLTSIKMVLRNVLYISYALPASLIRTLLPAGFQPNVVGEDLGFFSIVLIHCQNVSPGFWPFAGLSYYQMNLRTYITNPYTGKPAVFFLKSGITSPFISFLTGLISIPWQSIDLDIQVRRDDSQILTYQASGDWQGKFLISANLSASPSTLLYPFKSVESAVNYLIRPMEGFFSSRERLSHIQIRHPEIVPKSVTLHTITLPLLNGLDPLKDITSKPPHSVFFVNKSPFQIKMPPAYSKIVK